MTLKGWMLRKVNGPNKPRDRGRGAPSVQGLAAADGGGREPSLRGAGEQRNSMRETIAHLGPYATLETPTESVPDAPRWAHRVLGARQYTIAGGTSEIQRNIIGERVLGLPKG